jgi:hypothetical protein
MFCVSAEAACGNASWVIWPCPIVGGMQSFFRARFCVASAARWAAQWQNRIESLVGAVCWRILCFRLT